MKYYRGKINNKIFREEDNLVYSWATTYWLSWSDGLYSLEELTMIFDLEPITEEEAFLEML